MHSHIICMNVISESVLGFLLMFVRSKKPVTSTGVTKLCYFSRGIGHKAVKNHFPGVQAREVFMQHQHQCL